MNEWLGQDWNLMHLTAEPRILLFAEKRLTLVSIRNKGRDVGDSFRTMRCPAEWAGQELGNLSPRTAADSHSSKPSQCISSS